MFLICIIVYNNDIAHTSEPGVWGFLVRTPGGKQDFLEMGRFVGGV